MPRKMVVRKYSISAIQEAVVGRSVLPYSLCMKPGRYLVPKFAPNNVRNVLVQPGRDSILIGPRNGRFRYAEEMGYCRGYFSLWNYCP